MPDARLEGYLDNVPLSFSALLSFIFSESPIAGPIGAKAHAIHDGEGNEPLSLGSR